MPTKLKKFRNDLKPDLVIVCTRLGQPVDLSTATSVKFIGIMDGVTVFSRPATSADAAGMATMEWEEGDTSEVGILKVEVEALWDGKPETFRPTDAAGVQQVFQIVADYG